MTDVLADMLNKIKVYENTGRPDCEVAATRLVRNVLATLKDTGYISGFEELEAGKFKRFKIMLANKINDIGAIKPRHAVKLGEYQKYENRYIPSKDFGVLIVSTPKGIMSNKQAKEKQMGGRLIAYVY